MIFLDINLSGENGFDLLEHIDSNIKVIFVTAYDEYAIRAFEVNALDYILKPLKKERITNAVERLFTPANTVSSRKQYSIEDTIYLSTGAKAFFLRIKDIRYIRADSCYSIIVLAENVSRCSTKTLKKWEELLPSDQFVRIHRSSLVNINHIKNIIKKVDGSYAVSLNNISSSVEISRRYRSDLKSKLNL